MNIEYTVRVRETRETRKKVGETSPTIQEKTPSMFQVVLYNDDYTPMEFVVLVLERFFGMNREMATQVMLKVHTTGKAVCGVFTKDVADTKAYQVTDFSRMHEHPLLCCTEGV